MATLMFFITEICTVSFHLRYTKPKAKSVKSLRKDKPEQFSFVKSFLILSLFLSPTVGVVIFKMFHIVQTN
uniref:Uncharacterized protein n=1 Tax=Lepeophtheirus salmonis TaxID=72036 RepID=A0A0K2VD03_LEPSM